MGLPGMRLPESELAGVSEVTFNSDIVTIEWLRTTNINTSGWAARARERKNWTWHLSKTGQWYSTPPFAWAAPNSFTPILENAWKSFLAKIILE
jgi:hypothetical protein